MIMVAVVIVVILMHRQQDVKTIKWSSVAEQLLSSFPPFYEQLYIADESEELVLAGDSHGWSSSVRARKRKESL